MDAVQEINSKATALSESIRQFAQRIDKKIKSDLSRKRLQNTLIAVGSIAAGVALVATGVGAGLAFAGLAGSKIAFGTAITAGIVALGTGAGAAVATYASKPELWQALYDNLQQLKSSATDLTNEQSTLLGMNEIPIDVREDLMQQIQKVLSVCKSGFEVIKKFA
jgi:hypothetical protein